MLSCLEKVNGLEQLENGLARGGLAGRVRRQLKLEVCAVMFGYVKYF